MKEIEFVFNLQGNTPMVLCSILENTVTVHEYNQGDIALTVAPQIQPHKKHITINCHHFWSFVKNGDVDIQNNDTKKQIADIFRKPPVSKLFIYIRYKINSW